MRITTQIPRDTLSIIHCCKSLPVTILIDKSHDEILTTPQLARRYLSARLSMLKAKGRIPQSCYCRISGSSVIISQKTKRDIISKRNTGSPRQVSDSRRFDKSRQVAFKYIPPNETLLSIEELTKQLPS